MFILNLFLSVGVDIVLDPLGGSDTQKGFSLLKPLGMLIAFGETQLLEILFKNYIYSFACTCVLVGACLDVFFFILFYSE